MMKLNWKKSMAAVLAGIMSFGVLSTTLAVPAEASSRRTDPPRIEQDRDNHRPQPQISQRERDRDQARWSASAATTETADARRAIRIRRVRSRRPPSSAPSLALSLPRIPDARASSSSRTRK